MLFGRTESRRLIALSIGDHDHDLDYEPLDAAIVKSDEAETITKDWSWSKDNPIVTLSDNNSTVRNAALRLSTAGGSWYVGSGFSTGTDSSFHISRDNTSANSFFGMTTAGLATFVSTVTATNFIKASDRKLKKNIKGFKSSKFGDINFVQYELKTKPGIQYGVIAQDMREVYPEVVYENKDEDGVITLGVDYESLSIIGMQKIQELDRLLNTSIWTLIWLKIKRWVNG